jgi:hypothetical protein
VKEQRIHNIISDISAQFGLKKQPAVYICDKAASPSLMGFIHPVLLIPSDCYSDKELALILKHELTHYRQYDLWYKLFLLVVNAVHWFNPAVYLLRCEACIDLELSCDDEVIKGMSAEDRIIYGETILSCVSQQKMRKAALTTCFNDTAKTLKGRLKNILSAGKKRNGLIIIFISLIFIAGIGALVTFTGGGQKQKNTDGFTWYGAVDLISEETKLPDNLIEGYDAWNEFLNSDSTIALVAAIPEEDIYVYGLKENGAEEGTYTLRGICVRQGEELQVLDTGWGVYDEIPKLRYEDYDGDGTKELAMISRSSGGTNLFFNDLHILEKNDAGGWTDNTFDSSDWQDIINNRLEYQVKDGSLTIAIAGQDTGYNIDIAALEEEWDEKLTSVFFGNFGEFTFNNGKIYLQVLPAAVVGDWATPQAITETYIRMEVLYNGKFDLQNAFAPGPAAQEASGDSPEDEAGTETEDNPDEEAGTETEDNPEDEAGTETEDNPNMETLDSPDEGAGTETEDNPNMETLDSPVGRLNQEMTDSFVKAYFSGDKESAEKYMAENAEYDSYVYKDANGNEADVYDKLTHLLAKWYAASEEEAKVQYEYALEGEDSFTYLDLELKQEEGGWVITAIVLEK